MPLHTDNDFFLCMFYSLDDLIAFTGHGKDIFSGIFHCLMMQGVHPDGRNPQYFSYFTTEIHMDIFYREDTVGIGLFIVETADIFDQVAFEVHID